MSETLPANEFPELPMIDMSVTVGKAVKCKGWVSQKGSNAWAPGNVTFTSDLVVPPPGPRQVRIRMYAAGVNPADAQRTTALPGKRSGDKKGTHARRTPPSFEFPWVCGLEGSGVVESIGWDPAAADPQMPGGDLRPGDRVMFLSDITKGTGGSFAQYAVVDADIVTRIAGPTDPADPRMIDFVEAATFPAAAATAYVALFDKLRIEKGRSIFISGASGGVGTFAVQLARYFGLYVFASCSTPNVEFVEKLGADVVIDYTSSDAVGEVLKQTQGYGVDYVLECASATMSEEHAEAVRFGGALCIITGLMVPASDLVFRQQLSLHYVFIGMFHQNAVARPQLRALGENIQALYLQGAFNVYAEEVPLERAQDALGVIAQGHTRGKIVLTLFHPGEAAAEEQRRRRLKLLRERSMRKQ